MPSDLKSASLLEISQELTRFKYELRGHFRCPTCFRDLPIENIESKDASLAITEEHVIPDAVNGKISTFLCQKCNNFFGTKQTRRLGDWIELNEGGAPFHLDPGKQRAHILFEGKKINGQMKIADDGALEFYASRAHSDKRAYDAFWSAPKAKTVALNYQLEVVSKENMLRAGFLTAAYGLWFKHFGYSFVLQSSMDIVRQQIMNPDQDIMNWNYLIETPLREVANPCIGLMRFGVDYFPIALIYDHLVILPSAKRSHPTTTPPDLISKKVVSFGEDLAARYQHRCVGPAVLICDGQEIINPDLIPNATVPPQYVWLDRWN